MCVALVNDGGKEVGFLRRNQSEGPPVIHAPGSFSCFTGEDDDWSLSKHFAVANNERRVGSVDLIELSAGYARYQKTEWVSFDEWTDHPKSSELYEFYNVMMIRKEGEFVSRIAVGRVGKAAWESEKLVTEDIILG